MPLELAAEQAQTLSRSLLDSLTSRAEAPQETLEQLCALAIADDEAVARAASQAMFRNIVEPLGDTFDPSADDLYVRFFGGVIDYCRRQPSFRAFDGQLGEFGLKTREQLAERAARIRKIRDFPPVSTAAAKRVQAVLVPSRVTLGADIAVTSVILSRMKSLFPEARIALLGSAKAGSLFASDPRIELVEVAYPRGGTLRERLEAWIALCRSVSRRLDGLMPDEYITVDPDSRLTQLGLLPLGPDDSRYFFLESRSYSFAETQPLALLAGCWLDAVFGFAGDETRYDARKPVLHGTPPGYRPERPYVALPADDVARGGAIKRNVSGRLAAVNLGVGGNQEKRLDDPFEAELLLALLKAGYTLILDRGAGEEELERTGRLVAMLRGRGITVSETPPVGGDLRPADVFVWEGSLSGFGGLIASADLYCGYDSAGGHLAAAIGVRVISIFTDASPARFRERWTPWGEGPVQVVTARRSAPQKAIREFRAALREQAR